MGHTTRINALLKLYYNRCIASVQKKSKTTQIEVAYLTKTAKGGKWRIRASAVLRDDKTSNIRAINPMIMIVNLLVGLNPFYIL